MTTEQRIKAALALLNEMDDDITEHGGDNDEMGRRKLAKIRRAKKHLWRALPDPPKPALVKA